MKKVMMIWMIAYLPVIAISVNASTIRTEPMGIYDQLFEGDEGSKRWYVSENTQNEDDPATDDGEDLMDGDSDSNSDADSDKDED